MNARWIVILIVVSMLLAACSPAATPKAIATGPGVSVDKAPGAQVPEPQRPLPTAAAKPLPAEEKRADGGRQETGRIDAAPAQPGKALPTRAPASGAPEYRPPSPTQAIPPDNRFQDPGVNPNERASRDHLSTFSLDVDTASYTVMRNYLRRGQLPPYDSVRPEEYLNYFDPGYASPEGSTFSVYADGALSPYHKDNTYLVRFGVQGYRMSDEERKPINLTLVIDVSGSMKDGGRLDLVKRSVQMLVNELREDDRVAVVAFSTTARIVLNPVSATDSARIMKAINALQPENTTNVRDGLRLGYSLALKMLQKGATNRVVLCSDGVANVGLTDGDAILDEVAGYVQRGINLTTIGVGMGNFNDVLLEKLADRGNGNYAYVDTLEEARRVFVDNLTSTMEVIAYNAKVQVDFNTDVVTRYRLIGYENREIADQDFRNNSVDAGEIGAGHHAVALYAVQLKPGAEGRIATFQLRWEDGTTRKMKETNGNFNTWDLAQSFNKTTPRFQLAAAVALYAEILRQSPYPSSATLSEISRLASGLARALPEDEDVREFSELAAKAASLRR